MEFPLDFENFKKRIINDFLNNEYQVTIYNDAHEYNTFVLSREMKEKYLKQHQKEEISNGYEFASAQYVRFKDKSLDKYLKQVLNKIIKHCGTYIYVGNKPNVEKIEDLYPLSYKEFEKKVISLFHKYNPSEESKEWLEWFLNEDSPYFMKTAYETACTSYDKAVAGENGVTPDKIFTDYYIKSNPVRVLEMF